MNNNHDSSIAVNYVTEQTFHSSKRNDSFRFETDVFYVRQLNDLERFFFFRDDINLKKQGLAGVTPNNVWA